MTEPLHLSLVRRPLLEGCLTQGWCPRTLLRTLDKGPTHTPVPQIVNFPVEQVEWVCKLSLSDSQHVQDTATTVAKISIYCEYKHHPAVQRIFIPGKVK